MYNNSYEPCNYNNFPPNYLLSSYLKMMGKPAMLIWVFILGMFFAIPALVVGVVVASSLGIGFSVLRLAGVGITLAVIIVVITSLKFVLRIFAFKGSNDAHIPLLLFLWLTLIPESLSLVLTIPALFELIILLTSGNISEYCKYREFLHSRSRIKENKAIIITSNQFRVGTLPPI